MDKLTMKQAKKIYVMIAFLYSNSALREIITSLGKAWVKAALL